MPDPLDLPRISILVPLYKERRIAGALVERLRALDYPRGRLEVLLVLEEKDDTTAAALAAAALPPWMRVIRVPDGKPRTKPRAMNYALDFCRGDIIGVYDAEDAPEADQLLRVAAEFAAAPPEVACLQGRLDFYNARQNWLSRCFAIEYNTWFRVLLPGMARLGLAIPLGGTTLFVRRDALEAVGAWDAHNVTEDADLGLRLARHGWHTRVIVSTTAEEANCHVLPWIRQRSRWLKGYMVTYLVNMRRPLRLWRDLGPRRFLGFQAHFVSALAQFLLGPLLLSVWLLSFGIGHPAQGELPPVVLTGFAATFVAAELLNFALHMIGTRAPGHRHLRPWALTMILYFPLAQIAAYKALYELVVAPFYWDKTRHGLSKAARRSDGGLVP
ncbi:glycosyltransferase [Pseudooceanicola sp. LIPI14-2-Ac024]|uniref:glycosyltransferase n=1 Tax=Pseudooceanicola sp. LIPI14-2-Ac024 TaxID=3344875 RepID=UPI0035CF2337